MLSFIVDVIIIVTKFSEGAWAIVIILPLGVFALIRLHRQYANEEDELEAGAAQAAEAPILRRHVVIVLVDRLDMATARALQYARTLAPDDLRAVHFDVDIGGDPGAGARNGAASGCPDSRSTSSRCRTVAWPAPPSNWWPMRCADGETECTVLLPRRAYASGWQRFLHDRTADKISAVVSQVPHVSATIIPYNLRGSLALRARRYRSVVEEVRRRPAPRGPGPGLQCRSTGRARRPSPPAGSGPREGRSGRPTGPWPTGRRTASRSRRSTTASGSGWPGGSSRSGSSPRPAPPTSSAC